jgi:hypothetical protein
VQGPPSDDWVPEGALMGEGIGLYYRAGKCLEEFTSAGISGGPKTAADSVWADRRGYSGPVGGLILSRAACALFGSEDFWRVP